MAVFGILVGIGASFTGLGGGFLIVPLLLYLGFPHPRAVGTSFLGVLIVSVSALAAHHKLSNVDWRVGLALGVGGVIGAQVGARLVEGVSAGAFRKVFALVLAALAVRMFFFDR
jgi:uncharacterized membrane protein YfcA